MRAALDGQPEGNPSSPHAEGRALRSALDRARDLAAAALGVEAREIVFTDSGTEAVNLALLGAGRRLAPGRRVVTWAAEHQSVLGAARQLELEGYPVSILPVDPHGVGDPSSVPEDAGLVSIGLANNETGTLQPVAEVAERARAVGALLHLDACQGPAWLDPEVSRADLASISGRKIGAGRGGLLAVAASVRLQPLAFGGPQEWGLRAGPQDVASATAVAVALDACSSRRQECSEAARPLAARVQRLLEELGGRATGGPRRLPGFASAAFRGARGEDLLMALDLAGVAASSGSACASGSLDPSHVLLAMGLSLEEALGSLRVSLGYGIGTAEIARAEGTLRSVLPGVLHRRGRAHA